MYPKLEKKIVPLPKKRGFTFVEVMLAMTVVLMMALIFGAAIPIALRGTQQSNNTTEAALLAQHKIEQLRTLNFSNLGSYTSLQSQGIVDAANANGTYDFSTTSADRLLSYFPTGATGTLYLQPDTSTGTMQGSVYNVIVTVSWPASGSAAGTYTLRNKIIGY